MRFAAVLLGALVLLPAAADAETWDVICPTEARGTIALTGNDGNWVATPQSSGVVARAVEQIAGQPALVCIYRIFGSDYRVWRRPPPEVPNCRAESWGFLCTN